MEQTKPLKRKHGTYCLRCGISKKEGLVTKGICTMYKVDYKQHIYK